MMQEKTKDDLVIELHDIVRQLTDMGYGSGQLAVDLRTLADRLSDLARRS